uniref:Uncharacterized protein n=1 Tax=Romanomermis culicivorax TaxID=13658 RepID=A0A915HTB4_ROMCU
MGHFQTIERDIQKYPPIYSLFTTKKDFISTIIGRAAKAGLRPKSSSELQILIKSFCLGAQRRATFLPFPEVDPSILGIRSTSRFPPLLMKSGVDVGQNELLDDLRTVYMGDERFMKKKQVILKAISAASSLDASPISEFTTVDVAINVGFLAGGTGLGYAAQYAARKGATMVGEGSEILGTSLRLASPFLSRVTSAFVAYDLYKQVEAYKSGQDDAMVGIVADSVVLTIDIAALAIETLEVLGLIGSISFAFGPIGAAVGAIIFVAVDIYQAVKTVEKIDSVIKLTAHERFEEGLLAFVHASPEKYILELMKEKQLNNEQAKRSIEILSNMEQFQIYATPSLESCEPIKSLNICMNGVEEVENNVANFTRLGNFYSRTWPDTPNNYRVICADAGHNRHRLYPRLGYTIESWLSQGKTPKNEKLALECYSFEALFDNNLKKDGGIGSDLLDFSKYAKKEQQIQFYNGYKTAHILVVSGTNYRLDIDNIENFVGRPDAPDKMVTNCRTSFVDLQG